MVFTNFTKTESGNEILFKSSTPIQYVKDIKYYKDDSSGIFTKKEFRWSFNNDYWASWETLTQANISGIDVKGNTNLYIEVRYEKANTSAKVNSFSIEYVEYTEAERGACVPGETPTPVQPTPLPPQGGTEHCDTGYTNIVNADTLCGQTCDYYLWRPNHKGQQPISSVTDLQKTLTNLAGAIQNSVTDGSTLGDGVAVFYDKVGQDLLFRSLDASGPGLEITEQDGVIYFTVDASFSIDDASINELYDFYYSLEGDLQDLSIYVDAKFSDVDTSINDLWDYVLDLSLGGGGGIQDIDNIGGGPGEVFSVIDASVAKLRTLEGTGIIDVSTVGDKIIIHADASITADSSIKGATNIGGASGEIFSAIDASGNIELRTIDGSGATTVITSGDKVIISTELTADTSITNIVNVGGGDGLILAEIDSSGVAELRSISGTGAISVSQVGDQIVLYSDASITVDPCTWSDTDPISADVGGLQGGDYVATGTNAIEILEDILYEYFPPNVSMQIDPSPGPTSSTGYYEKWVDTPIANGASLTYSYNNNDFTKVRVYDVSIYENGSHFRTDSWGGLPSITPYTTFDPAPDIGTASTDLIYSFEFGNKLTDGTAMPNYDTSVGLHWVDPYFYGTVDDTVTYSNITNADILGLSGKVIAPEQSNEIEYDVSSNFVKTKFVYAYPASYNDLRSIFDVKNDFNVTTSFDSSIINVKMSGLAGPGPYIPYKVYIKSHWISFPPDVSIFKLNFNI